jgi:hypothetical protein
MRNFAGPEVATDQGQAQVTSQAGDPPVHELRPTGVSARGEDSGSGASHTGQASHELETRTRVYDDIHQRVGK